MGLQTHDLPPPPAVAELRRLAGDLPTPASYFSGACPRGAAVPHNVLVFSRLNRRAMQPRDAFRHRRFVLAFNLAAPGSIALDGHWLPVRPGEAILVFPNQVHAFGHFATEELCWLFVTFELADGSWLDDLRSQVLGISSAAMKWLHELVRHWHENAAATATAAPYFTALLLHELKAPLVRRRRSGSPASPDPTGGVSVAPASESTYILPRVHAVLERGQPPGGIKSLARKLGISESHLRFGFRQQTGTSLGRYLRETRLKHAAALLAGTRRPVGDIAQACGFNSADAFARAFRQVTGTTPRAFRRRSAAVLPPR